MPDITDLTTVELLQEIQATPLTAEAYAALTELFARVIQENDSDNITYNNVEAWKGGVRPVKRPLV